MSYYHPIMRRYAFVDLLVHAFDRLDLDAIILLLDDQCFFQFGNNPLIKGKTQIRKSLEEIFYYVNEVQHQVYDTIEVSNTVVNRGYVTYSKKDNIKARLPFCNVFKVVDGKIVEFYTYADYSTVFNS